MIPLGVYVDQKSLVFPGLNIMIIARAHNLVTAEKMQCFFV